MNEKFMNILSTLAGLKPGDILPIHNHEELNKYEVLQNDFLHNLQVLSQRDELIRNIQEKYNALYVQMQKKEYEVEEIKKEYKNLVQAQDDLYKAYNDVRRKIASASLTENSSLLNSENDSQHKDIEQRGCSDECAMLKVKLQEKICFLENQLKENKEENSKLHDQNMILQHKVNKLISVCKNEIQECKCTQKIKSQHHFSLLNCEKLERENLNLNNTLNLIVSLVIACSNALGLKHLGSFHKKMPIVAMDIYNFIKTFIQEINQKITECNTLNNHLVRELKEKNKNIVDLHKNYKERITQQELELQHLKQKNSLLMNVIKEMKQKSKFYSIAQKCTSHKDFNKIQKSDDFERNEGHSQATCEPSGNLNAEEIMITLNRNIKSLVQKRETDQESEYEIKKLEDHLISLKDLLIDQVQKKMSVIENSECKSVKSPFSDLRLMILEEKINQFSSGITTEVASSKEELLQIMNDIKSELGNLQHACHNLKAESSTEPTEEVPKTNILKVNFINKLEALEKKVQRLELFMQQKNTSKEDTIGNLPTKNKTLVCGNELPPFQDPSFTCHLPKNKGINSRKCGRNSSERNSVQGSSQCIVEDAYERNKVHNSSPIENIWADLNEDIARFLK